MNNVLTYLTCDRVFDIFSRSDSKEENSVHSDIQDDQEEQERSEELKLAERRESHIQNLMCSADCSCSSRITKSNSRVFYDVFEEQEYCWQPSRSSLVLYEL